MFREVPIPLVRFSQAILVAGTILATIYHAAWIIYVLTVMVTVAYFFGPRIYIPFIIGKPLFGSRLMAAETESAEQLRFNQSLAVLMLVLSSAILLLTGHWSGYVVACILCAICIAAMFGYCIGCKIYLPIKLFLYRHFSKTKHRWILPFVEGVGPYTPRLLDIPQPLAVMGLAHIAIRNAMDELETLARSEKPGDFDNLAEHARAFVRCLGHHATQEDDQMFPALERYVAGVSERFAKEHVELHESEHAMLAALEREETDADRYPAACKAVMVYIQNTREHMNTEDDRVQKWVPYKVSIRAGAGIVSKILNVNPDEFSEFHAGYIFSHLRPGQRYTYARVLHHMLEPEKFVPLENIFRSMVSPAHWNDFISVHSRRPKPAQYSVAHE